MEEKFRNRGEIDMEEKIMFILLREKTIYIDGKLTMQELQAINLKVKELGWR